MKLGLPNDSLPVREMFERFFAAESTSARVRAAEPVGFDPTLWSELVGLEAPFMRLAANAGGGGMSLFDACLMMEQAGRRLAPAPLAESVVALRMLGELGGDTARRWIDKVRDGKTVLVVALHEAKSNEAQLVPGGAVAQGILTFDGREVAIEVPRAPLAAPSTLGGAAIGVFVPGSGERHVITSGADAASIWAAGCRRVEATHLRRPYRIIARGARDGGRLCVAANRFRPADWRQSGDCPSARR